MISYLWYHSDFSSTHYIIYDIIYIDISTDIMVNEIMQWFHCMISWFDFNVLHQIYDVICLISCYDFMNCAYDIMLWNQFSIHEIIYIKCIFRARWPGSAAVFGGWQFIKAQGLRPQYAPPPLHPFPHPHPCCPLLQHQTCCLLWQRALQGTRWTRQPACLGGTYLRRVRRRWQGARPTRRTRSRHWKAAAADLAQALLLDDPLGPRSRGAVHPTVFVTSRSCPLYCLQLLKPPVTFRLRMTRNL